VDFPAGGQTVVQMEAGVVRLEARVPTVAMAEEGRGGGRMALPAPGLGAQGGRPAGGRRCGRSCPSFAPGHCAALDALGKRCKTPAAFPKCVLTWGERFFTFRRCAPKFNISTINIHHMLGSSWPYCFPLRTRVAAIHTCPQKANSPKRLALPSNVSSKTSEHSLSLEGWPRGRHGAPRTGQQRNKQQPTGIYRFR
jgi:hypothetical protein